MSSLPPANKVCEGYVFTPVCHSVQGGGVSLCACWDTHPSWEQTPPPGADTPRKQTPPRADIPLGADTPHAVHAGRYGQ